MTTNCCFLSVYVPSSPIASKEITHTIKRSANEHMKMQGMGKGILKEHQSSQVWFQFNIPSSIRTNNDNRLYPLRAFLRTHLELIVEGPYVRT